MEGKILALALLNSPSDWYQQVCISKPLFHELNLTMLFQIYRYTASSVVAIGYGRRILDTRTDMAYQKLNAGLEFLVKINVPGAQCMSALRPIFTILVSIMG